MRARNVFKLAYVFFSILIIQGETMAKPFEAKSSRAIQSVSS